jgi:GT2 family glycosyltransferase/glycosyltransferase involved in cell wall biosynthesis
MAGGSVEDRLMKVLVVAHGFPPAAQGGAEIYARAHARALQKVFGDEVQILAREGDAHREDWAVRSERRDDLDVVWVNNLFRRTRDFRETYRNEAIGAIAARVIDDFNPDVAHVHHLTGLSTTIVETLAERRIPCFFTLHDYWLMCHRGQLLDVNGNLCDGPRPTGCGQCVGLAGQVGPAGYLGARAMRRLERALPPTSAAIRRTAGWIANTISCRRVADDRARARFEYMHRLSADVTRFLAPSRYVRDRFEAFGIPPAQVTVSRYGFDIAPFVGLERTRSDRLRLGFLGSLMVSKAPHLLLEAAAGLRRGSVSVDLFGAAADYHGDDAYRHTLEPLLKEEYVRVHGPIPHEQVPRALASIDVLCVPSIWPENSPLVIQEAFLAGVPVIASRIGGIPEVVDDGRNGLLFTAGDPGDLGRMIGRLLSEPLLLDRLRRGIPAVRTIQDDVGQTRRLYEAELARRGARCSALRPRIAAVVLDHRTPDETLLAVKSLLASKRPVDQLIVVSNNAIDGARTALQDVLTRITYLDTGENLGFSAGMNVGIREGMRNAADLFLLVNSDVIVPPDTLEHLERCLASNPSAGIAGPAILVRSEPDRVESLGLSYSASSGRMRLRGFGRRFRASDMSVLPQPAGSEPVAAVSGCFMLVRRGVFEGVGLLDDEYFFSFEDLDLCLRARSAGFATIVSRDAVVYHGGSRSIGPAAPARLYYAARNHLRLASRTAGPAGRVARLGRAFLIVALNVAHAIRSRQGSLPSRLRAVATGTLDYVAGRFGAGTLR